MRNPGFVLVLKRNAKLLPYFMIFQGGLECIELWKIINYGKNLARNEGIALFNLPSTHFLADSEYPKIIFRVPIPTLTNYKMNAAKKCYPNFEKKFFSVNLHRSYHPFSHIWNFHTRKNFFFFYNCCFFKNFELNEKKTAEKLKIC